MRIFDHVVTGRRPIYCSFTKTGVSPSRLLDDDTAGTESVVVPFQIDDIVTWYFNPGGGCRTSLDLRELGPVVPPYPKMWCEWDTADVEMKPMPETDPPAGGTWVKPSREAVLIDSFRSEDGWALRLVHFAQYGKRCFLHTNATHAWLDENGRVVMKMDQLVAGPSHQGLVALDQHDATRLKLYTQGTLANLSENHFSALLACVFTNTKNVTIGEEPDRHTSKSVRRKLGNKGLVRFKTIELPRTGGKRPDGRDEINDGGPLPLHLVRGHFKTFTADKPLLGKHVGTYWWPHHARGNPQAGVVVSDYKVDPLTSSTPRQDIGDRR